VRVRLARRHVERGGGDHCVRALNLPPVQAEDVLGRLAGIQLPLGVRALGKKPNDSPPTTLRNQ
jgi:hypothetical protein